MSVMPQVAEDNQITLILRPTLSRVVSYVDDPAVPINLALASRGNADLPQVVSRVPQIQTREMESVIKVRSGDTVVLGGLMRENFNSNTDQTPGLGDLPGLGELFKYKSRNNGKSELVIFLRPTVVTDASLAGDYQAYEPHLTDALRAMPERPLYPSAPAPSPRRLP
jgi:general secretion pathway protein D